MHCLRGALTINIVFWRFKETQRSVHQCVFVWGPGGSDTEVMVVRTTHSGTSGQVHRVSGVRPGHVLAWRSFHGQRKRHSAPWCMNAPFTQETQKVRTFVSCACLVIGMSQVDGLLLELREWQDPRKLSMKRIQPCMQNQNKFPISHLSWAIWFQN